MACSRFLVTVLSPVVVLLLLLLNVEAHNDENTVLVNGTTESNATTAPHVHHSSTINMTTKPPSTKMTTHKYFAPQFGGMLKRLIYVTLVLSAIIALYFLVKFCRSRRRKPRKYGVVKTPGDMEMRPLESDDDDDEDITMFNKK